MLPPNGNTINEPIVFGPSVEEELIQRIAPGLRGLSKGGYLRQYRRGTRVMRTSTHELVGQLLDSLRIRHEDNVRVPGVPGLSADFLVNGTYIFVEKNLNSRSINGLISRAVPSLLIRRESLRSDTLDHGIRVVGLGEDPRRQTIFLDDPSFNFDYAHILPLTQKCSVMHGHTSSVLVEIVGRPVDGMVVDFGIAKEAVRDAVRSLDHKLFIRRKYVASSDRTRVNLKFRTVHGEFEIKAPKATTILLDGEATVENLAGEVLSRISPKMPPNVTAVGVYVYEGLNKGSHLLAQIHQDEEKKARRKP